MAELPFTNGRLVYNVNFGCVQRKPLWASLPGLRPPFGVAGPWPGRLEEVQSEQGVSRDVEGPDPELRAELIDEITEAVVKADQPSDRAQVIADLVHEVDEVVKWRHQPHPGSAEEQSLTRLVDAAATHQHDMNNLDNTIDPDHRTHPARSDGERSGGDERSADDPSPPAGPPAGCAATLDGRRVTDKIK